MTFLKSTVLVSVAVSLFGYFFISAETSDPVLLAKPKVAVLFSPKGGCTKTIVDAINGAKTSIRVQAYSFTAAPIYNALVEAKKRNVDVAVILDRSALHTSTTAAQTLAKAGIQLLVDDKHAIAHNKIVIIDEDTVLTGSFNYTAQAEKSNAENLVILHSLVPNYRLNWTNHAKHSVEYESYNELKKTK